MTMDDQRPSYEDLARRDAIYEAARRQEQDVRRGHDAVYIGIVMAMGILGLIMYFFVKL